MSISKYTKEKRKYGINIFWNIVIIAIMTFALFNNSEFSFWVLVFIICLIYSISSLRNNIINYNYVVRLQKIAKQKKSTESFYDTWGKKFGSNKYSYSGSTTYKSSKKSNTNDPLHGKTFKGKYYRELNIDDLEELLNDLMKKAKQQADGNKNYSYRQYNNTTKKKNGYSIDDAFQLFKLNKSSDIIIIKKKYRELAKKWHPDKWSTDKKENQKIAERNFQKVNNAYGVIKQYKGMK